MKPSKRRTLGFKKTTCANCTHADKRALRKGWPYCSEEITIRSGHCNQFNPVKPKKEVNYGKAGA